MRHSWSRRTPMKLISEGPPSYRGSASSCCNTIRSACRHHCPRRLRSATAGYREQLSEGGAPSPRRSWANPAVGQTIPIERVSFMPFTEGDVNRLCGIVKELVIPLSWLARLVEKRIIEPGEPSAAAEEAYQDLLGIEECADLLADEVSRYINAFEEATRTKGASSQPKCLLRCPSALGRFFQPGWIGPPR